MNDHSFKLMEKYIPATYVQQAQDARRTRANLVNQLLEKVHQLTTDLTSHLPNFCFILNFIITEKVAQRRMERRSNRKFYN